MKDKIKISMIIGIIILMLFLVLFAGMIYRMEYEKTKIITSVSNDDQYSLQIYMVGEPEWPFGRTHCCFELKDNTKKIIEYKFSVRNDGCFVSENNFDVNWYNDYVIIYVSGEEQNIVEYKIEYNSNVIEL